MLFLSAISFSSGSVSRGAPEISQIDARCSPVDPSGQYASSKIPSFSHHSFNACCGLYGWSSTWLTAGTTVHFFLSSSRYGIDQFETPIALTLPDLYTSSICAQVFD